MKIFKLLIILLTISLYSCNKEDNSNTEKFLLSYAENSGWTSYSYQAKIDQDGRLIIKHQNMLSNINYESVYQINKNEITLLKEKMTILSEINLADNYGFDFNNSPKDLPVRDISYQNANKTGSTSIYFPSKDEMPSALNCFIEEFQKVINEYDTLRNK